MTKEQMQRAFDREKADMMERIADLRQQAKEAVQGRDDAEDRLGELTDKAPVDLAMLDDLRAQAALIFGVDMTLAVPRDFTGTVPASFIAALSEILDLALATA